MGAAKSKVSASQVARTFPVKPSPNVRTRGPQHYEEAPDVTTTTAPQSQFTHPILASLK
jgi:hypothetical protein